MFTICRTCLQKSSKTYKANQTLPGFDGEQVKISDVLRFCIPELYLGVTSNPELCYECLENLKTMYLFKKKCLNAENIIGNYLKNTRCTAKCVDLHDVLCYDDQTNKQLNTENARQHIPLWAQAIISEWGDIPDEEKNNSNVEVAQEVQRSAPNSTVLKPVNIKLNFCEETGFFVNEEGDLFDSACKRVNKSKVVTESVINFNKTTANCLEVAKECSNFIQNADESSNFCKITDVYSLSEKNTQNANKDSPNNVHDRQNLIDIKAEPVDDEINGEEYDFNNVPTDEETLDASESDLYEKIDRCESSLQEIINSLPQINDINQYVDVPDLVQINNFGLKDLAELRLQQQQQKETEEKNCVVNCTQQTLPMASDPLELSDLSEKDSAPKENKKQFMLKPLSTLPDTLILNGKQMVRCPEGYKLLEDGASKSIKILSPVHMFQEKADTQVSTVPKKVERLKKKIKIAPVNEKTKLCVQKGRKLNRKIRQAITAVPKAKPSSKLEDKDVVVLFTKYTLCGHYINDHDYLINPYKRNKVLIQEDERWFCMCYICHTRHAIYEHVSHMKIHGSKCKICNGDFGSAFMLNVHVRAHNKLCRQCRQRVPYGLMDSHLQQHEVENENDWKRVYGCKRKPDDELVNVKMQQSKLEPDKVVDTQSEELDESSSAVPKSDDTSSNNKYLNSITDNDLKKLKKRKRKNTNDDENIVVPTSSRVLRSNVRKCYSETENEDIVSDYMMNGMMKNCVEQSL